MATCRESEAALPAAFEAVTTIDQRPVVQPAPVVVPPAVPPRVAFPTWGEFPVPTEVPGVTDIAQRVKAETDARKILAAQVSALTWDKEQAEPFAAAVHARMDPRYATPVDPAEARQEIQSLLNKHFTPPPPVN